MKSFEILHFSYRDWPSYHDKGCYNLNLVFRIWDIDSCSYTKERFLNETKEWQKIEIVTDLELAEKYVQGLRIVHKDTGRDILEESCDKNEKFIPIEFVNDNGLERDEVYIQGYSRNWNSMLSYNEKFDCFRFNNFFIKGPVTDGIITMIEQLRTIETPDECAAEDLLRCIKSLDFWWD